MAVQLQHSSETASEPGCSFSFKDLTDALNARTSVPSLPELNELMEQTKISADELRPYLGFKTGNYSRHRVMKNEFVEMLVLSRPQRIAWRGFHSRRHYVGDDFRL